MAIRLIFLNHRVSVISEGETEKGRSAGRGPQGAR
jgi:hypothetical protein